MQIRIFSVNVNTQYEDQEEMNKFLRSHRVIEVRQQYDENRGLWTFAVSYLDSANIQNSAFNKSEKIDYRHTLSPEIFEIFTRLREQRKIIAKDESIPAYAIFTDKELSLIASLEEITENSIMKIEGINKGRMEKYGRRLLNGFNEMTKTENEA